ncbi:hypothetical protein [Arthrobacter sp. FW306-04-A]
MKPVIKRVLITAAAVVGAVVASAGPALAGVGINHSEPLSRR